MMEVLGWTVVFLIASEIAYKVVAKKPGNGGIKHKLMCLLPLLPLFLYLPWLPSSCHVRTIFAMVLLWTAPSKLLLLCFNTPLDPFPASFSQFLLATFLPIHIHSLSTSSPPPPLSASSSASSGYGFVGKLLLLVGILNIYPIFSAIPNPLLYFLYCCHFYLGLEVCLGGIARIVEWAFSVRLYAQFNEPLKSASLAEFWGRRWNLTISSILKHTIYKPLLKSSMSRLPASKALAMLASFATSGLLHELIFVYVSQSSPTGEMTVFFLLHGLATAAEVAISSNRRCPVALRGMPTWLSRTFTLSFLYATVSFFFMRPLTRSKTDVRAISEYHYLQSTLLNSLGFIHTPQDPSLKSGITL